MSWREGAASLDHLRDSSIILVSIEFTSDKYWEESFGMALAKNLIRPSALSQSTLLALPVAARLQAFSVFNRPPPNYPGHVPLLAIERVGLAVGSAIASMVDHHRHGEVSWTSGISR